LAITATAGDIQANACTYENATSAFRQCRTSPAAGAPGDSGLSGAGGHEGGENIVRVTVQVLAGSVVPHRGARVCVARGDLDIAQVNASIELA
jgi:hypothetical protein